MYIHMNILCIYMCIYKPVYIYMYIFTGRRRLDVVNVHGERDTPRAAA